jgi:anhydro-N-acetylmuramic acid kinase
VSPTPGLFAGLMSGTSLDGVDGVLVHLADDRRPRCLAHVHHPFSDALRLELLALNAPGADELHRAALAANAIARLYAAVMQALLHAAGIGAPEVRAVGAHGQTVRHRPGEFDGTGYTAQLLNGALLAELTGIDVVCDLRSRDVAAGGQGAPLVPAFHRAIFSADHEAVAVLNIGGIANLTLLPPARADALGLVGFDCGPGNVLMDGWCETHTGHRFDEGGRWAASGRVDIALLRRLLTDSYFDRPPPKSTGRDLFHRAWLDQAMADVGADVEPADVQATLAELTALSAADALQRHAPATQRLLVCGGGAHNSHLMRRLAAHLPDLTVSSTDSAGVPADQVEAMAFAWLAQAFVERHPGNLPSVTGARGARVLGALHPAG